MLSENPIRITTYPKPLKIPQTIKIMITKKYVLLFCFLSVSFAVFSQNAIEDNKKKTTTTNTSTEKGANIVIKPTEKIQTTDHGMVTHQVDYTPKYPTSLFEQKPEPLNPAQND